MESKRSLKLALLVSICFIVGLTGMAFMPTSLSAGGPTKAAILGSTLMGFGEWKCGSQCARYRLHFHPSDEEAGI